MTAPIEEPDLRMPTRLRGIVGSRLPSCDTIGRVYALLDSEPLRRMLRDVAFRLKRNKAIANGGGWYFAAVDGHEFFRQPQFLDAGRGDGDAPARPFGELEGEVPSGAVVISSSNPARSISILLSSQLSRKPCGPHSARYPASL